MAISGSFNLSQATTSQSYAYKCWYNYNYGGNTMGISAKDMGEITQTWNTELTKWRATAKTSQDENKYEIADDDLNTAKMNAKDTIKDETGCSGKKGGMIANSTVDTVFSVGGGVATLASTGVIRGAVGGVANKAGNAIKGIFGQNASKAGKSGKAAKGSAYLAAAIAIAVAAKYRISKPNKTEKNACDELQNSMTDAQASLASAQGDMESYASEIEDLSDEAHAQNEDANDSIEEDKTEFDMYKASYDALIEKVKSGEPLNEDEQSLLNELIPLMQELGINIQDTSEEATDYVGVLYDEMGTYQDGYDEAAATMAEVEGVTDYAEGFDSATRTSCYVEAASQGLNAISGATAGARLLAGGPWNWVLGGAAIAAGVSSTIASKEQIDMAGDVGTEISMRKETQDINIDTQSMYDENIDVYAGQLENVEDLELEIPDDIEAPETPETPTGENGTPVTTSSDNPFGQPVAQSANGTTTGSVTSNTANNQTDDKKKDKKV